MDYLPQEIVIDILSRLPITSILQFKLVCRSWLNLAQNPLLPSLHFSSTGKNDPCLILHSDNPVRNQLYSLELSSRDKDDQSVNRISVPLFPEFDVVGSCKGLLCLCDASTRNELYVYNPFTGDYLALPKSADFNREDVVFGFGCHPTTKQCKVVKVDYTRRRRGPRNYGYGKSEVQIFTLGGSTWRSLGQISYHFLPRPSQVLINGRLHWCTWPRYHGPSRLLVSFDLANEQFRVVPKPDCGGLNKCRFDLVVLGGCLSAAVHCNYGEFEVWVMKEYDVKESWIKEINIGSYVPRGLEMDLRRAFRDSKFYRNSSFVRILCLLKNGDILLEYRCRALVSYNSKNETFKDVLFNEMPYLFEASVHEGSLNRIDALIYNNQ
ncbi:F-box protein [Melia azedarach]|uniref:F-box protein n=1 Tax=Melia azedarach TaxID=155640 RepID=A0ACC1Z2E2_MELAZ|nr:F-box protein [Melia azedarach]